MPIQGLTIEGLRNLQPLSILPSARVNFIYGDNGSGKSSLLEAIYILASGKSFRTSQLKHAFKSEHDQLKLSITLAQEDDSECLIESQRTRSGNHLLKMAGSVLKQQADAAQQLPVLILDPNTFKLLSGSPEERRQFIDWGVFHVEHTFMEHWKIYKQQLKQRNALLKEKDTQWLATWNAGFVESAMCIDQHRKQYLEDFTPEFKRILVMLDSTIEVELNYYAGWEKGADLHSILTKQEERDLQLGYTQSGPHRGELRIKVGKQPAAERLSRGQQKSVVSALKIAQGTMLKTRKQRTPIYLIDDLASELDQSHRFALCRLLEDLKCQVFVTSIDKDSLLQAWQTTQNFKMFHVEHGNIQEQTTELQNS